MQEKVVPMFHVPDVRQTVEWYRDIGFAVTVTYDDNEGGLSFALVSFGEGEVMFSSGGRLSKQQCGSFECHNPQRRRIPLVAAMDVCALR